MVWGLQKADIPSILPIDPTTVIEMPISLIILC